MASDNPKNETMFSTVIRSFGTRAIRAMQRVEKPQNKDALMRQLSQALASDPWIRTSRAAITISCMDGTIRLEGVVLDLAAKRRAVALAGAFVSPPQKVVDALRRRAIAEEADEEIAETVASRLLADSVFSEHTIVVLSTGVYKILHDAGEMANTVRVQARDGEIALTGRVGSLTHRRFAEVLAWSVAGCEAVTNLLAVVPAQEDTDDELNDAVRMSLENDALVDATSLSLGTAHGEVIVQGTLTSGAERQLALNDIWAVPGVCNVNDRTSTLT